MSGLEDEFVYSFKLGTGMARDGVRKLCMMQLINPERGSGGIGCGRSGLELC